MCIRDSVTIVHRIVILIILILVLLLILIVFLFRLLGSAALTAILLARMSVALLEV